MKDFFKEILVYNFEMNNKLIMLFENHPNEISEKAQLLLSHLINAQHLWNNRILNQYSAYKVWENLPLEVLKNMNAENLETSELILQDFQLETIIDYKNTSGEAFKRSVKDIIFHYCNHSNYHRAQIATELKTNNVTPPITDYIYYKKSL